MWRFLVVVREGGGRAAPLGDRCGSEPFGNGGGCATRSHPHNAQNAPANLRMPRVELVPHTHTHTPTGRKSASCCISITCVWCNKVGRIAGVGEHTSVYAYHVSCCDNARLHATQRLDVRSIGNLKTCGLTMAEYRKLAHQYGQCVVRLDRSNCRWMARPLVCRYMQLTYQTTE